MDWFVRSFIKASLVWFGAGTTLGACMAVYPQWVIYRPAHMHMNLLGFVTMMIYGVAYHVMPRFTGNPLFSRRLAVVHWWVSNAGLALMVAGFALLPHVGSPGRWVVATGGVVSTAGAFAFIWNIWRTLDGRPRVARPAAATAAPSVAIERAPRRAEHVAAGR